MEKIKDHIRTFVNITDEDLDSFLDFGIEEKLGTGDHYIEYDQVCNKVSFIQKGFFRFYHFNDGNEVTRDFLFENNFITSYRSFITGMASEVYVQALEECELITFRKSDLEKTFDTSHKIERFARIIAEHQFISIENYYLSFLNDDAETRYKKLLEKNPRLVQKIPLKYIASFLGITPQHLSRIRKN